MRKLMMFNMLSIDGYFEAPNHDISWHTVDEAFNDMAKQQQQEFDTLLFGNTTYTLFEEYWPGELTGATNEDDKQIAQQINDKKKIVVSSTRTETHWDNSEILKGDVIEQVKKLKQQEGGAIMIYGSGKLVRALTDAKLIDEYRIMISPVVLGKGTQLFEGVQKMNLKLLESKSFVNGNVWNKYGI